MARRYVRDMDEAEDVAHEALIRAFRQRTSLNDPDRFTAWLTTIVRNEAFRRYELPAIPLDAVASGLVTIDPNLDWVESRSDFQVALRVLDDRDRMIVMLRYEQDLTHRAIARVLQMPVGTVKVRLHRARAALRRTLEKP